MLHAAYDMLHITCFIHYALHVIYCMLQVYQSCMHTAYYMCTTYYILHDTRVTVLHTYYILNVYQSCIHTTHHMCTSLVDSEALADGVGIVLYMYVIVYYHTSI
jgi:hypothetical protein